MLQALFYRINTDDIAALVESHEEDLTAEDLVELQKELTMVEEEEESPLEKTTTMGDLKDLIKLGLTFIDEVLARDGDVDRSFRIRSSMKALLSLYEEELRRREQRRSVETFSFFFSKATTCKKSQGCFLTNTLQCHHNS